MTHSVKRYAHIDALRALAVMIVVLGHAGVPFMPGDSGVTVFFVISGFIITHLLLRERERTGGFSASQFYLRRSLKLMPPFLVLVIIPTLVYSLWGPVSWPVFATQILFSYNWAQILFPETAWLILPGSNVTWSLAVEEQFYIAFSIVWLFLVKRAWWRRALLVLSIGAIVASSVIRLWLFVEGGNELHILRGTDTRMESIAWGILAALVFAAWRGNPGDRRIVWIGKPATLVGAATVFLLTFAVTGETFTMTMRYSVQSVVVALLILYGLMSEPGRLAQWFNWLSSLRIVTVLGLSSYSIYLAHDAIIHALSSTASDMPLGLGTVFVIALGVIVGVLSYYVIEIPALHLKERLTRNTKAPSAAPAMADA